jgi:hypothetical protein
MSKYDSMYRLVMSNDECHRIFNTVSKRDKVMYSGLFFYHHGMKIPLVVLEFDNKKDIQEINRVAAKASIAEQMWTINVQVYGKIVSNG